MALPIATALVALLSPSPILAVEVQLSATVVGSTPERVGFNSGHFMATSNTAAWWKYSGVNAARVWSTPIIVEGADDSAPFGDGVGTQQQFIERRAALRANPLSTAYINWPHFESRYLNLPTTGSNFINLAYAYGALHDMGVDTLVTMHRSSEGYPFNDPPGTAGYWAERWEHWQHFYAQAFYLAKNFDVHRFQMYNEPNHSSNSVTQAEYLERLLLASDAVQSAVADVNALYGKSLDVQMHAPVTAGGSAYFNKNTNNSDPRDDATGWGQLVMQNLHTTYLGEVDPNFQLVHTYAVQQYNLTGPAFAAEAQTIKNLVAAAAGGTPMRLAFSEFNVHTAAAFENTSETMDSPSKFSRLGSILANLANAQVHELYLQKFSLTLDDSPSGVKKNGLHYVDNYDAPYNIGGITKGGEVARLFAKGFAGAHDLLATPPAPGIDSAGLDLAAAHDAQARRYSLLAANTGNAKTISINLAPWNIPVGALVTVEEVSDQSHGEVRHHVPVPASRQVSLPQPATSVWLITVPEFAPRYHVALGATDDAMVQAGSNSSRNFGSSPTLFAKNDPFNASARAVSFIKFNLGEIESAGVDQAILRVVGRNSGSDPAVITHVYGIASDAWSESTITWDNAPNLGFTPGIGLVNDISQNFIEDVGGTATVLGHFTGTQAQRELMLDVTSFVKDHPGMEVTFLIAREVRYDGENVDDALASLELASKEQGAGQGPQLLLSLNERALSGDFNGDGTVDAADLSSWNGGAGMSAGATAADGDADFDGDVDGVDFLRWQQALGSSLPVSLAAAVVPEPAAWCLFALPAALYAQWARIRSVAP